MKPKIYDMKLHEAFEVEELGLFYTKIIVIRVAGGWIYRTYNKEDSSFESVFVPFNNEFMMEPSV